MAMTGRAILSSGFSHSQVTSQAFTVFFLFLRSNISHLHVTGIVLQRTSQLALPPHCPIFVITEADSRGTMRAIEMLQAAAH